MKYVVGAKHDVSLKGHYSRTLKRAVVINLLQTDEHEMALHLARASAELERSWRAIQNFMVGCATIAPPLVNLYVANTRAARNAKSVYETAIEDKFDNGDFSSYIRIIACHSHFVDNIDKEILLENETLSLIAVEFEAAAQLRWLQTSGACTGKVTCSPANLQDVIIDIILDICIANSSPIRDIISATQLSLGVIYQNKVEFVQQMNETVFVAQDAPYVSLSSVARRRSGQDMETYVHAAISLWHRFCAELQPAQGCPERDRVLIEAIAAFPKSRQGQLAVSKLLKGASKLSPGPYFLSRIRRKPSLKIDQRAIVTAFGINVFRVGVVRLLHPSAFGQLTTLIHNGVIEYVKLVIP